MHSPAKGKGRQGLSLRPISVLASAGRCLSLCRRTHNPPPPPSVNPSGKGPHNLPRGTHLLVDVRSHETDAEDQLSHPASLAHQEEPSLRTLHTTSKKEAAFRKRKLRRIKSSQGRQQSSRDRYYTGKDKSIHKLSAVVSRLSYFTARRPPPPILSPRSLNLICLIWYHFLSFSLKSTKMILFTFSVSTALHRN